MVIHARVQGRLRNLLWSSTPAATLGWATSMTRARWIMRRRHRFGHHPAQDAVAPEWGRRPGVEGAEARRRRFG